MPRTTRQKHKARAKTEEKRSAKRKAAAWRHPPDMNAKLDDVVLALVEAVDSDHAKQLVEETAEEPEEVGALRMRLRGVLFSALRETDLLKGGSDGA